MYPSLGGYPFCYRLSFSPTLQPETTSHRDPWLWRSLRSIEAWKAVKVEPPTIQHGCQWYPKKKPLAKRNNTHTHTHKKKKTRVAIWLKNKHFQITDLDLDWNSWWISVLFWNRPDLGQDQWPEPQGWPWLVVFFPWAVQFSRDADCKGYRWWLGELEKNEGGIEKFAEGYKIFGWNRDNEKGRDDGIGWCWCWIGYTRVQVLRLVCKHQEVVRNKTIW